MKVITAQLKGLAVIILVAALFLVIKITAQAYPKSLLTPVQTDYLGAGFNSLKESYLIQTMILKRLSKT